MKKILSFLIVSIMILSSALPVLASQSYEPGTSVTITDGELVADNYDSLTEGERAMLRSALIAGGSRTVSAPDENSVTVDPSERTVKADAFTASGLTWKPTAARVVYEDGTEDITLSESGNGAYEYTGNVYSVEVDYSTGIAVGEASQRTLLNGPYYFRRGLQNLIDTDGMSTSVNVLSSSINTLVNYTDESLDEGLRINEQDAIDAINALKTETTENESFFAIEIYCFDYEFADSKSEYLLENGSDFVNQLRDFYDKVVAISNCENLDAINASLKGFQKIKFSMIVNTIRDLADGLEACANDDWAILNAENAFLKSGLTAEEYAELDGYAEAIKESVYHDDEIKEELLSGTVTLRCNVNQYNVSVTLNANVIANTAVDSDETSALETRKMTLQVLAGATADEVLEAIANSGIEDVALAAWIDVDEENYVRTASELPETVNEDIEYVITYDPKELHVTYGFETELPTTVPYGYNMTLPLHGGDKLVYDYEIGGKKYLEGDVYKATSDFTVNRS
ncbi:MAG: hypothetical protein IJS45_02880, partial [Clostridia bacterium]|nr:hypothetical protein [Clostridia bacterium]